MLTYIQCGHVRMVFSMDCQHQETSSEETLLSKSILPSSIHVHSQQDLQGTHIIIITLYQPNTNPNPTCNVHKQLCSCTHILLDGVGMVEAEHSLTDHHCSQLDAASLENGEGQSDQNEWARSAFRRIVLTLTTMV